MLNNLFLTYFQFLLISEFNILSTLILVTLIKQSATLFVMIFVFVGIRNIIE